MELVAAIRTNGTAILSDRTRLEFDDVGCRRMVFPDGLRNVYSRRSRSASSRSWVLSSNCRECQQHSRQYLGSRDDDRRHRADGSVDLAADYRVGGKI